MDVSKELSRRFLNTAATRFVDDMVAEAAGRLPGIKQLPHTWDSVQEAQRQAIRAVTKSLTPRRTDSPDEARLKNMLALARANRGHEIPPAVFMEIYHDPELNKLSRLFGEALGPELGGMRPSPRRASKTFHDQAKFMGLL